MPVPHNGGVFRPVGILLTGLACCLAGCATAPTDSNSSTEAATAPAVTAPPATTTTPATAAPPKPAPAQTAPPPIAPYHPVMQFNNPPPTVSRPEPSAPAATWTSLDHWAVANDLGAPHRLTTSPVVTYALGSRQGVMIIEIGSRDATWNGAQLHLGFAPEIIDDQIFVHSLDLAKNFAPLLCESPSLPELHHIIVIDPGHGGREPGAISVLDNRPEKAFTLDVARRLAPLLEARGWTVYLTRTNDSELAVTNRAIFSVQHGADLFISLHFNSSAPDHKQNGLETYCLTPVGMPSTLTRGYPDIVTRSFPANAYDQESLWLAVRLHAAILRATGEEDRGVRRARFLGVLQGQHCPAVLIENGYLSNPQEATKIENGEFRQKIAEAIANALR